MEVSAMLVATTTWKKQIRKKVRQNADDEFIRRKEAVVWLCHQNKKLTLLHVYHRLSKGVARINKKMKAPWSSFKSIYRQETTFD